MSSNRQVSPVADGGRSIPALFTRIDGGPTWLRKTASASCRLDRSVTSAWMPMYFPAHAGRPASFSVRPASSWISIPTTLAPASSSAAAHIGPSRPHTPVTIATSPVRENSVRTRANPGGRDPGIILGLGEHGQADVGVLFERDHGPAAKHLIQPVRLHPVARRLEGNVVFAQYMTGRQIACRDELLPHLVDRRDLPGAAHLDRRPHRLLCPVQASGHLGELRRVQREVMVTARTSAIQGEVLFDHSGAERIGDAAHLRTEVVPGIANDDVWVL